MRTLVPKMRFGRLGPKPAMAFGERNAQTLARKCARNAHRCAESARLVVLPLYLRRISGVETRNPRRENASKMHTLKQKVGLEASKTCTLRQQVRQKHVPLGKKSAPVELRDGNEPLGDTSRGWSKTSILPNHTSFLVYFATCRI